MGKYESNDDTTLAAGEVNYRSLFENMIEGFALHRIVVDDKGKPIDYLFLEVNPAFERLTGLKRNDIIGKRVTEVLPGIENDPADWIGTYGKIAMTGGNIEFEQYSESLNKWFVVSAYSPMKDHFATIFMDITERRKAQDALRMSEEKYRLLFQNMAEGFAIYELLYDDQGKPSDWRILEVNDAYSHHTGLPREQIVGRRISELYPAAIPEYLPRFAEVVASQKATEFETYSAFSKRYQHVFCFPAGPNRFANTITDVTESKMSEAALREQEAKASALINAADESIWLFSLDGTILAANTTAARRFSKSVDEVVGIRWPDFINPELATSRARRVDEVVRTGSPIRFEDERAGIIFDHSAYPVRDDTGKISAVAFFSRDITELKRAEESLRESREDLNRAQEVGGIGSWRLDVRQNVLAWSDENYRIFGIPKGTPLTYETFLSTLHPDDREYVDTQWNAALRGEPYDIEHRLVVDGRIKWVREKAYLELDHDGALIGGFGITQDITKRKESDEALRRAHDELEMRVQERTEELHKANRSLEIERRRFFDVLEMLPVYVILLTPDHHVQFANRFFQERFGESGGKRCYEYLFERSEPCTNCDTYTVLKTNAPHYWEWKGPDGRNYDVSDFPFTDTDGSPMIMEVGVDITERLRAQEALRRANAYNRRLIETSLDPLVTINADGKITDVNAATEKVTGYSREALIGTDFFDYFTEPENARAGYQQVFQKGLVKDYELEIRHRDGHVTPVLYNAAVYHDEAGTVIGVFASARDITERKEQEHRTKVRNSLLKLFTQKFNRREYLEEVCKLLNDWSGCVHVGVRIVNPQNSIPFEACFGYDQDFLKQESRLSLDEDRCICPRIIAGNPGAADSGSMTPSGSFYSNDSLQFEAVLSSDEKSWYRGVCMKLGFRSLAVIPIKYREKSIGALHLSDERAGMLNREKVEFLEQLAFIIGEAVFRFGIEEEQMRLASAVMSAADGVVITEPIAGTIQYVNPAFEQITGYSKEDIVGRTLHVLDSGKHDESFFRDMRDVIRREGVWQGRLYNKKKDGTLYLEDCTCSPVRDQSGKIINYVLVKRDVTDKVRLESIAESVNMMNNIGYIFSGVRHEIGNPINSAKMILSVLQYKLEKASRESIKENIDRSLFEIGRVEQLLKNLKNFNLYEKPELQNLDLATFMQEFMKLVKEDFERKGILVRHVVAPDAEWSYADPRALQQVLMNLLTNAADALVGRDDPMIDMTVKKEAGLIHITVTDNGTGMTDKQMNDLFKPFYTSKQHGTGLGLVIVKKMLARMNCDIAISSVLNKGTVVDISMPEGGDGKQQ
jgi:PAS domain S-box-containing protein